MGSLAHMHQVHGQVGNSWPVALTRRISSSLAAPSASLVSEGDRTVVQGHLCEQERVSKRETTEMRRECIKESSRL